MHALKCAGLTVINFENQQCLAETWHVTSKHINGKLVSCKMCRIPHLLNLNTSFEKVSSAQCLCIQTAVSLAVEHDELDICDQKYLASMQMRDIYG